VINSVSPVTVTGNIQNFNQSLNTTDYVAFAGITTPTISGPAQAPVYFPTGISVANVGTTFNGSIDMAGVFSTFTNQLSLLFALLPLNFGTVTTPSFFSVNFGNI
jgi:hypothetical protein